MSRNYKIGQVLKVKQTKKIRMALSGEIYSIPSGTKAIIGADGFAHYLDGCIQPLEDGISVHGYDTDGISEWVMSIVQGTYPEIAEALADYGMAIDDLIEVMSEALTEIGFYVE